MRPQFSIVVLAASYATTVGESVGMLEVFNLVTQTHQVVKHSFDG